MSLAEAICVSFPPKTGTNLLQPRPPLIIERAESLTIKDHGSA